MNAELIAEIEALGLQTQQLDDIVHSEAEVRAAGELNEGGEPGDEEADSTYSHHSAQASEANNEGIAGQVDYLLQTWTVAEVRQQVIELLS